ncbi:hypothetical protein BN132_3316 [Cronobacter turicensis 564]|nr:hypothetical protein BN132_3316 [Cronobacter turicensis 564]
MSLLRAKGVRRAVWLLNAHSRAGSRFSGGYIELVNKSAKVK